MARVDTMMIELIEKVLNEGRWNDEGRGEWGDGKTARAKSLFGVQMRYYPNKESGLLHLKPTPVKWSIGEMLWIHQDKSNDITFLEEKYGVRWWRAWADAFNTLDKAYGYQANKQYVYRINDEDVRMTQIDYVRWALKHDKDNRRLRVTMWNPEEQHEMQLPPCAHTMEFRVWGNELHMKLQQRSQDVMAASNINAFQYIVLGHMLAKEAGLDFVEFVHEVTDFHIYDRHIEAAQELVRRFYQEGDTIEESRLVSLPKKDFYDYEVSDVRVVNYKPFEKIDIEIAKV